MNKHRYKLLSLLTLTVLLLGGVLPVTLGLAFANGNETSTTSEHEQESNTKGENETSVSIPTGLQGALNALPACSPSPPGCKILEAEQEGGSWKVKAVNLSTHKEVEAKFTCSSTCSPLGTPEVDESHEVDSEDRKVEVESSSSGAVFKLEGPNDELKMIFETSDVTLKLEFQRQASAEVEFESKVVFKELIEYRDVSGGQANKFDPGVDAIVKSINLETLSWNISPPTNITGSSTIGKQISASANLPNDGNITLVFKTFGTFTTAPGVYLWPTSMKIDVRILGYPFNATSTGLALLTKTEFSAEGLTLSSTEDSGLLGSVQATFGNLTFVFQWNKMLESGQAVTATVVESKLGGNEIETNVFLNYPKISTIVHDPQVGLVIRSVSLTTPSVLNSTSILIAAVTVTAVAAGLIILSRRTTLNHAFPASR